MVKNKNSFNNNNNIYDSLTKLLVATKLKIEIRLYAYKIILFCIYL